MTHATAAVFLAASLSLLTADPPKPTIIVAPGGSQPAPAPQPTPQPAPIPTSVRITGAEFELLTLVGYTGTGVTWDVSSSDSFAVPVKLIKLNAKETVIGIRAGATVPDRHESPETPSVAVFAVNTGTAIVAAWGNGKDGPVKLATFRVEAGLGPRPPDPVKPDGVLGLIKASRDGLARVTVATKAADAVKLAKSQRGLASAIAAGGLSQPAAILAAWRDGNRASVDAAAFKPWADSVTPALQKLYTDGKLPDKAAWISAFTELAEGLEGQ